MKAKANLQARRKFSIILKQKSTTEPSISLGDTVEIYSKKDHDKRGKRSTAKAVLTVGPQSQSITVPGRINQVQAAAFENVPVNGNQDEFTKAVTEALDKYDDQLFQLKN